MSRSSQTRTLRTIERTALALVSNDEQPTIARANDWLGKYSPVEKIRQSGVWNIDHVDETYHPAFLETDTRALFSRSANTYTDAVRSGSMNRKDKSSMGYEFYSQPNF